MTCGSGRKTALRITVAALFAMPLAACVGVAYGPVPVAAPFQRYDLSSDVLFDFGSATLRPGAESALQAILAQMRAVYPYPAIRVEGYTDSIGAIAANDALSTARAETVKRWLIGAGIPPQVIAAQGFGEQRPVAPNTLPDGADNPAGRAQNRRVELIASPA